MVWVPWALLLLPWSVLSLLCKDTATTKEWLHFTNNVISELKRVSLIWEHNAILNGEFVLI